MRCNTLVFPASFLLSLASASVIPRCLNESTPAQTSSGLIQGHVTKWPAGSTVLEYLGIPFAKPPVGDLRFAPPKAYTSDSGKVYVADKYYPDCMQFLGAKQKNASAAVNAYGYGMGGGTETEPHEYSEDCLALNIWTKPSGEKKKAVMVWIYGGAFTAGTSHAPFYNGARLAEDEDVVVVGLNYRVNVFGFPHAPGLTDQNLGLLDQRLAVEWVRDNIEAFGGDPSRITLFGESAGGSSVDYYSYAWTEDPIVNGFITQSGTAFILNSANSSDQTGWYNLSKSLNCGGAEAGEDTLECVRGVSAEDLNNAVGAQAADSGGFSSLYIPVSDERIVFSDVRNRSRTGKFIQKPYFAGNNDNELGLILAVGGDFLGGAKAGGGVSTEQIITLGSALAFNCPAGLSARDRANNKIPTWRYRYMGSWPNSALVPGMGAYHSAEIPMMFGTNALRPNSTADVPEQAKLSKLMVHAWAEFAKDPEHGLSGLGWPKYNPNGTSLIRLGYNNQSMPSFGNSTQYDTLCANFGY